MGVIKIGKCYNNGISKMICKRIKYLGGDAHGLGKE